MSDLIRIVLQYLTDMPLYFWLCILIVTPPIIALSVNPSKNIWLRFGRLAFAAFLTYVFIMFTMGAERSQSWREYNECYASHSELRDMSPERSQACKHYLDRVPDSTGVFVLLLGWIPALGYVGLWELIWRIKYRQEIKRLGKEYKGKWVSNALIFSSIITGLFIAYFVLKAYYYLLFIKA